ncbi:MAG: fatty-acyl-CoA synthase [Acidimicrobiia bacterium]|jgi:fatty-acyl-CoA synthase|nr:fatty-acyl-CoA synthase [Acidimicrobiia bacterium]
MDWFRKRRLGDLPAEAAARWGDRWALVYKGKRWTHAEFAAEVDRVAKGLIGLGVEPGEKVGIWMVNRPEWLFLMYAIPRVGAVTVPLNTRYRTDDVAYTVHQSDTVTLVANDRSGPIDYSAMLREALPGLPKLKRLVILGDDRPSGALGWEDLLAAGETVADGTLLERAAAVDPDAPTLIIYTSGTTSLPKGAVHSHVWIRNVAERAMLLGNTCDDVQITYLPLFHAYGYSEIAAMTALTGGTQVLVETFDPEEILDLAESEGVTIFHGFDAQWTDLLRAQQARPRQLGLRYGSFAAGMESSTPIAYRTQEVFCPTVSGWGMSETWAFVSASHPAHSVEQRCEGSGYPMLDIEVRVIDPATGDDVPADTPGELLARGYTLMHGYYEKPAETAEAIDAEGWMHTGDLCRIRADGHLVFMGRLKDMLKIGGENVAPAEVEGRLRTIDGVIDAAVVGYPDPRLGEVAVAYVSVEPGVTLDEETMLGHLRGRIASFKIPRHLRLMETLPMTPSGKVRKVELRALALEELGDPNHG